MPSATVNISNESIIVQKYSMDFRIYFTLYFQSVQFDKGCKQPEPAVRHLTAVMGMDTKLEPMDI